MKATTANTQKTLKLVILGDGGVGKTSLCTKFTINTFSEKYVPTVAELASAIITNEDRAYKVNLFDVAGGEDFYRLRPLIYPGTDIFLLCFAINDFNSYNNLITSWLPELSRHHVKVPFILVGTKCDLKSKISQEQGIMLQKIIKAEIYLECSSKTGKGVSEVFDAAVTAYLKHRKSKKKKCIIS
ncbi:hypothetical protein RN001_007034 [Aquatica leii]|uniref:Uncharacterized protein n=1 Tax=Aquatica leii TaxID=1421715 RepID=A0AAN7Q9A6_9COLE|nr:hypothetical protein RN001_007034 [Aquatica leii]